MPRCLGRRKQRRRSTAHSAVPPPRRAAERRSRRKQRPLSLATYSGGHHAYGIKLSGGQKLDVIFKPGKAPYQKNGFKYKNQVILTFAARTIEKPSSPRPRPLS